MAPEASSRSVLDTALRPRYLYASYGLAIASEVPLGGLPRGRGRADLDVRRGDPHASPGAVTFGHPAVGSFSVAGGARVRFRPAAGAAAALVRSWICGPAFAVALRQRGLLVLHGSAVELGGRAFVFLAASGGGKSTLAAALVGAGARLLADDLAVIGDGLLRPGGAGAGLWPDAAARLGLPLPSLPRVHPASAKRLLPFAPAGAAVPVGAVLLLAEGPAATVRAVPPAEAAIELVRHTYGIRSALPEGAGGHLAACAALARAAPVLRLERPRDLAHLPASVDRVLALA